MKKKIQKYLSGEREGFSLIELIIVIAIMAILIGVIALVVLPYLESARENRDRQSLSEVSNAFKSAISAQSSTTEYTNTQLSDTSAIGKAMRKYMDGTIKAAEDNLASKNCTGKHFFVNATKDSDNNWTVTVYIGESGTPAKDGDGNDFSTAVKEKTAAPTPAS